MRLRRRTSGLGVLGELGLEEVQPLGLDLHAGHGGLVRPVRHCVCAGKGWMGEEENRSWSKVVERQSVGMARYGRFGRMKRGGS